MYMYITSLCILFCCFAAASNPDQMTVQNLQMHNSKDCSLVCQSSTSKAQDKAGWANDAAHAAACNHESLGFAGAGDLQGQEMKHGVLSFLGVVMRELLG